MYILITSLYKIGWCNIVFPLKSSADLILMQTILVHKKLLQQQNVHEKDVTLALLWLSIALGNFTFNPYLDVLLFCSVYSWDPHKVSPL